MPFRAGVGHDDIEEDVEMTERITNPYILKCDLIEETGLDDVDDFLYSLINIVQIAVGECIRSILAIGSCVNGGHYAGSDIDVCFLIKEDSDVETVRRKLSSLRTHFCRGARYFVDPLWNEVETPFYDAANFYCGPVIRLAVKEHSKLLWGEDVRPRIALCSRDELVHNVVESAFGDLRASHCQTPEGFDRKGKLSIPLVVPFPERPDLGYGNATRFTNSVITLARTLICLQTGDYVFSKIEVADAYAAYVGGPWTHFVHDAHNLRYADLSEADRQANHLALCRQMIDFENYYLQVLLSKGIDVPCD